MHEDEFRVVLTTKDGSLIQNRKADKTFYYNANHTVNTEFTDSMLKRDCQSKGVKLLSYTIDKKTGIRAVVCF